MKYHSHNILSWAGASLTGVVQFFQGNSLLLSIRLHDWQNVCLMLAQAGGTAAVGWVVTKILETLWNILKRRRK